MDLLQCWHTHTHTHTRTCIYTLCFPPIEFSLRLHSRIETEEYLIERLEVKFYLTIHYGIFLSVITFHFFKDLLINIFTSLTVCLQELGGQKRMLNPLRLE